MRIARSVAVALGTLALATTAAAGPPLLCHPFDTGGARSLPWAGGRGWNQPLPSYDRSHLVADTVGLLGADVPVVARMETLRRAAIYATADRRMAQQLLDQLLARAQGGEALFLFDAGYLAETYKQAGWLFTLGNPAARVDGYAMVVKALALRSDPEMEFAAALIAFDGPNGRHQVHLDKAREGAPKDTLLAANLASDRKSTRLNSSHLGISYAVF